MSSICESNFALSHLIQERVQRRDLTGSCRPSFGFPRGLAEPGTCLSKASLPCRGQRSEGKREAKGHREVKFEVCFGQLSKETSHKSLRSNQRRASLLVLHSVLPYHWRSQSLESHRLHEASECQH